MPKLRLGNVTIGYDDTGRGPPVVLLHGSASSRTMWHGLTALLAPHYRVVAPHWHGGGQTGAWTGLHPITALDEGETVLALAREIAEPFHLVGHGYGAVIGLHVAPRLAPQLLTLTLIEPVAFQLLLGDEADGDMWDELSLLAREQIGLAQAGKLDACAEAFTAYWFGADAWAAMPRERQEALAARMPRVAAEWRALLTARQRLGDLARLDVPLLLLCGSRTTRAVRRVCQLLASGGAPRAELAAIRGGEHWLPATHPSEIHAALVRFIARGEPVSAPQRARPSGAGTPRRTNGTRRDFRASGV